MLITFVLLFFITFCIFVIISLSFHIILNNCFTTHLTLIKNLVYLKGFKFYILQKKELILYKLHSVFKYKYILFACVYMFFVIIKKKLHRFYDLTIISKSCKHKNIVKIVLPFIFVISFANKLFIFPLLMHWAFESESYL